MKKIFGCIFAILVLALLFVGCDSEATQPSIEPGGPTAPQTITITFRQDGYEDITRTLDVGTELTDIPVCQSKVGYTVSWQEIDWTELKEDTNVYAVEIPNEYTITLKNDTQVSTKKIKFDAIVSLPIPDHDEYQFVKWVIEGTDTEIADGSRYTIADDVTLIPVWNSDNWTGIH